MKHILIYRVVKIILLGICLSGNLRTARGQGEEVCPTVPDFMDLTQSWVTATYGTTQNPFQDTGVIENRHSIITQQGTDEYTGGQLKILPDGVSKVIRLGNYLSGGEVESITYRFIVDRQRPVLLLNFAVVFEDPNHDQKAQPRFAMQVLDPNDRLIESCMEYDVSAGADIKGFQTYSGYGTPVRWRDWTAVGINLSDYAGKEIRVRFITYDCEYWAHFGYAYFYASCISARIAVNSCEQNGFELSAPDHFEAYAWSNGQTDRISQWTKEDTEQKISCELTSVTGCRFSLYSVVTTSENMPRQDTLIYDTVCEGEPYKKGLFDLPPLKKSGTFTNTYADVSDCNAKREITAQLALHVWQMYYPVEDVICGGEDYDKYGFHYHKPAVGNHKDTLLISASGRCKSYQVLDLHVASSGPHSGVIIGDASPCSGTIESYRISYATSAGEYYKWEYPEGFSPTDYKTTLPEISLRLPAKETEDTLKLHVTNGCGTTDLSLPIKILPSYRKLYEDSVCTGISYRKHGLSVPPRKEAGIYTEVAYYKTPAGCDSTIIVELEVLSTPEVSITLTDSLFCVPEEITLTPVVEGTKAEKNVGIGDVLCTDGSIISTAEYKTSGKTAKGIVFWVDYSGLHGWAVDVWENPDWLIFGSDSNLPLKNHPTLQEAIQDFEGEENTKKIVELGRLDEFPTIKSVTHAPEWYLPALGQLDILFSIYPVINRSLNEVGGSLLRLDKITRYYSSTLSWGEGIWTLEINNNLEWNNLGITRTQIYARGICNF